MTLLAGSPGSSNTQPPGFNDASGPDSGHLVETLTAWAIPIDQPWPARRGCEVAYADQVDDGVRNWQYHRVR